MRKRRSGPAWLLSLGLVGCTIDNPDYTPPGVDLAAPDPGEGDGGGGGADLSTGPGVDLRGGGGDPDLRPSTADMRPACADGTDCASRICLPGGTCASPGDVIYVDNRNGACMGSHAGTQADPVCEINDGVELALRTGKQEIWVAGNNRSYAPVQIDTGTLNLHAPGGFFTPTARIESAARAALRVSGGARVLVDGFNLESALDVVQCAGTGGGTASLTITRSAIHESRTGQGVNGSRCQLTVQRSAVYGNLRQGVSLDTGGQLLIENSYILANTGGGVRALDVPARLRFLTLTGNGSRAVECNGSGGSKTIEGSIVVDNARPAGVSQISSSCRLLYSAFDEGSFGNGMGNRYNASPNFVSTFDRHLTRGAGSNACCIDQLDAAAMAADVLVDYDGTARPQGMRWDIGAHEVK